MKNVCIIPARGGSKRIPRKNIRDFCVAHPEYIMPVEPRRLVKAVKEKLEMILKRYDYI